MYFSFLTVPNSIPNSIDYLTNKNLNSDNSNIHLNIFKYYCCQEINKLKTNNTKKHKIKYTDTYYLNIILQMLNNHNGKKLKKNHFF